MKKNLSTVSEILTMDACEKNTTHLVLYAGRAHEISIVRDSGKDPLVLLAQKYHSSLWIPSDQIELSLGVLVLYSQLHSRSNCKSWNGRLAVILGWTQ